MKKTTTVTKPHPSVQSQPKTRIPARYVDAMVVYGD